MPIAAEAGRPRFNHRDHSKTPWPPPIHPDRPNATSHSRLGGGTDLQAARAATLAAFREKLVFGNAHEASAATEAARLETARAEAEVNPKPKNATAVTQVTRDQSVTGGAH